MLKGWIKSKYTVIVAVCLVVGASLSATAVINKDAAKERDTSKVATLKYHFKENTDANIADEMSWELIALTADPVDCGNIGDLPCVIQFDTTDFLTLNAFLATYDTASKILATDYDLSKKESVD